MSISRFVGMGAAVGVMAVASVIVGGHSYAEEDPYGGETPAEPELREDQPKPDIVGALKSATDMTLYATDENYYSEFGYTLNSKEEQKTYTGDSLSIALRDFDHVYGGVKLTKEQCKKVGTGVAETTSEAQSDAKCFLPRHALRFTSDKREFVVSICFECDGLVWFTGDGYGDNRSQVIQMFSGDDKLRDSMNKILKDVGVTPAREAKKIKVPEHKHEDVKDAITETSWKIIDGADKVTLYSIDPDEYHIGATRKDDSHLKMVLKMLEDGKGVFGKMKLERKQSRGRVLMGAVHGFTREARPAMCFIPRHAIVAEKGKDKCVMLVCFECGQGVVIDAKPSPKDMQSYALWDGGEEYKKFLNNMLTLNGIKIAD